ncbi:hypothetical protein [Mesorhizobium argentiipisi]|uniref:Porin n=1 Tax=Mesorhizobium argentiipisi TaxID=3015175 RepID=A0ABU8KAP0_9HYPH
MVAAGVASLRSSLGVVDDVGAVDDVDDVDDVDAVAGWSLASDATEFAVTNKPSEPIMAGASSEDFFISGSVINLG